MAVVVFKKSHLSYLVTTPGYEDANGDYIPGDSEWVGNIACHVVPAGKAAEITYEDGTIKRYSYTLNMPVSSPDFEVGDRVRIRLTDTDTREFAVLGFHRYQLQCKMWI